MSETTPDSTTDAVASATDGDFASGEAEPSMDDILASIRKIIADDADPVPLEGPISAAVPEPAPIEPVEEEASILEMTPPDFQSSASETDDIDLDALLTAIDVIEPEAPEGLVTEPVENMLPSPALESEPVEALAAALADDIPTTDIQAETEDDTSDEMDRLMSELLVGLDEELPPVDPIVEDAGAADLGVATADIGTGEDLDLVKSLMADLTDEDVMGAVQTSDSLVQADADLAIPPEPMTDDADEDILESILNMTLEDEIAALEAQVEAENAIVPEDALSSFDEFTDSLAEDATAPSLADIAASAEADAETSVALETEPGDASALGAVKTAAVGAAFLGGAALATRNEPIEEIDETPEADTSDLNPDTETLDTQPEDAAPEPTPKVETPMPSALRSDAILDEVTEEATMSAFAELNNVVEEKAVFNERGPRIGDLVQEALKPMLKEWLDANLKGIVERAVAKEVKRISSGK